MDRSDLLVGVIAGVISALLWTLAAPAIWWGRRRRRYGGLRGKFEVRQRFGPNRDVLWIASLIPAGNRLQVSGARPDSGRHESYQGEILMSEQLSNSGLGHYVRDDEPDAFGFWRIQMVDNDKLLSSKHGRTKNGAP